MSLSTPGWASRKNRLPISSNHNFDHNLLAYAAAASAAGVGILALAQPSEAEVVFTPVNQTISPGSLALDLTNDGTTDFNIVSNESFCSAGSHCIVQSLTVSPTGQNRVWTT
jgi:hypothetical protein